jgi:hypothetical protein
VLIAAGVAVKELRKPRQGAAESLLPGGSFA